LASSEVDSVAFSHVAYLGVLSLRVARRHHRPQPAREDMRMTVYDETTAIIRTLAARARATDNVLFCEQRPLTSLELRFVGNDHLATQLREIEDAAIQALKRLVDGERGYEAALQSIEDAGGDATDWLRAVTLARALETLA
jgi:hypothetical protein